MGRRAYPHGMSDRILTSEPVAQLIRSLRPLLDGALADLPPGPAVHVRFADIPSVYAVDGQEVLLSQGLAGPDMHHPLEGEGSLRLDRWRRVIACILEGVVLVALADACSRSADLADWRWVGLAVELADHACPDLQLGLADLVRAAEVGCPGEDPRQGIGVYRALRRRGDDPMRTACDWITGARALTGEDWLEAGAFVVGAGLAAEVGVPVDVRSAVDVPVSDVPAWSWLRLDVPAHRRGGEVIAHGGAVVGQAWAKGGERLKTLAGALDARGSLKTGIGGPAGTWENVSAHGFGQPFGVRGITWTLRPDGGLELLLADAFAGPVEALEMAGSVGTSGVVPGRWSVGGERALRFSQLVTSHLTMHGRDADPFVVPAGGALPQALQSLQEGTWSWRLSGEELWLSGHMMGGPMQMRFRRSG